MTELSNEQEAAVSKIVDWLDRFEFQKQQVMRMTGPAGSGKTTIMREIAKRTRKRKVHFVAFAGKAAQVLRNKGCDDAETIHKAIYIPRGQSVKTYREELEKLETITNPAERAAHESKLEQMRLAMQAAGFVKKLTTEFDRRTAFAADEGSMIDNFIGADLCSHGFPVLVVGDPFQLPPVSGTPFFFPPGVTPDIELKHIHRQAAGSPVLRLATAVRSNMKLPFGKLGDSSIVRSLPQQEYLDYDQILCGTNKNRVSINVGIRKLLGRKKVLEPGEKLICLQNNYEVGVMNGSQWEVLACSHFEDGKGNTFYRARLKSLDEEGVEITATIHLNPLLEGTPSYNKNWTPQLVNAPTALVMTYGYCITVHKAQGSQWGSVVIVDDWQGSHYMQWLYTALTRAAKRVTLVRKMER